MHSNLTNLGKATEFLRVSHGLGPGCPSGGVAGERPLRPTTVVLPLNL